MGLKNITPPLHHSITPILQQTSSNTPNATKRNKEFSPKAIYGLKKFMNSLVKITAFDCGIKYRL